MDETLGWVSSTSEQERLLAFWLYGDAFVTSAVVPPAPWAYGDIVGLCTLRASTPFIANLRARTADCPG